MNALISGRGSRRPTRSGDAPPPRGDTRRAGDDDGLGSRFGALTRPGRRGAWARHRLRRWGAAVLAGAACAVAGQAALDRLQVPTHRVVVTTRDIAPGARLTEEDVVLRDVPPAGVPAGAVESPAAVVGGRTTAGFTAGEIVTPTRISAATALTGLPADTRALHVPLADPSATRWVRPGDRVDVLSLLDGSIVGRDLAVVAVDDPAPGGLTGSAEPAGVVIAAPPGAVARLARTAYGDTPGAGVTLALRPVH